MWTFAAELGRSDSLFCLSLGQGLCLVSIRLEFVAYCGVQILLPSLRIGSIIRNRPGNLFANMIEAAIRHPSPNPLIVANSGTADVTMFVSSAFFDPLSAQTNQQPDHPQRGSNHERYTA